MGPSPARSGRFWGLYPSNHSRKPSELLADVPGARITVRQHEARRMVVRRKARWPELLFFLTIKLSSMKAGPSKRPYPQKVTSKKKLLMRLANKTMILIAFQLLQKVESTSETSLRPLIGVSGFRAFRAFGHFELSGISGFRAFWAFISQSKAFFSQKSSFSNDRFSDPIL